MKRSGCALEEGGKIIIALTKNMVVCELSVQDSKHLCGNAEKFLGLNRSS